MMVAPPARRDMAPSSRTFDSRAPGRIGDGCVARHEGLGAADGKNRRGRAVNSRRDKSTCPLRPDRDCSMARRRSFGVLVLSVASTDSAPAKPSCPMSMDEARNFACAYSIDITLGQTRAVTPISKSSVARGRSDMAGLSLSTLEGGKMAWNLTVLRPEVGCEVWLAENSALYGFCVFDVNESVGAGGQGSALGRGSVMAKLFLPPRPQDRCPRGLPRALAAKRNPVVALFTAILPKWQSERRMSAEPCASFSSGASKSPILRDRRGGTRVKRRRKAACSQFEREPCNCAAT